MLERFDNVCPGGAGPLTFGAPKGWGKRRGVRGGCVFDADVNCDGRRTYLMLNRDGISMPLKRRIQKSESGQ